MELLSLSGSQVQADWVDRVLEATVDAEPLTPGDNRFEFLVSGGCTLVSTMTSVDDGVYLLGLDWEAGTATASKDEIRSWWLEQAAAQGLKPGEGPVALPEHLDVREYVPGYAQAAQPFLDGGDDAGGAQPEAPQLMALAAAAPAAPTPTRATFIPNGRGHRG